MNKPLGKNQQALMSFLMKHPNRWHSIKGRKATEAADRLVIRYYDVISMKDGQVCFKLPEMLVEQSF